MDGEVDQYKQIQDRDRLYEEGEYLYMEIQDEHFELSRHQIFTENREGTVIIKTIPWMHKESVCIALALFARKKGIQDAINNV